MTRTPPMSTLHLSPKLSALCCATAAWVMLLLPARAIINPQLQPADLFERLNHVFKATVVDIDEEADSLVARVDKSYKGDYAAGDRITIAARDFMANLAGGGSLPAGTRLIAFAGQDRPRSRRHNFLFYSPLGFGSGVMESPARWTWNEIDEMLIGTWAGSVEQLINYIEDYVEGTAFLPRQAFVRFKPDLLLYRFEAPARGVALYDINGNGRLDIYATSEEGDILLYNVPADRPGAAFSFVDGTDDADIADLASRSVSFADVNANGRADLLADDLILLQDEDGRFVPTELLPAHVGHDFKTASFVELNGDGYPDVIVSLRGGGLRAYLNPGSEGGQFIDATDRLGLEITADGDGFFAPGDWSGNGRTDLFYAAGGGLLLLQNENGRFEPLEHNLNFDFTIDLAGTTGKTGAGVFAPIFGFDAPDLAIPLVSSWLLAANRDGVPVDLTRHGGEITENSFPQLATIAEDLSLDGNVDLYTVVSDTAEENRFIINRGYGLFMHAEKNPYYASVFDGPAHDSGGWGVAAGDISNNGAPDLLISNLDGRLTILLNETLELRAEPVEHPIDNIATLQRVGLVSVRVLGRLGVLGATVTLENENGERVAYRRIGSNTATGNREPDSFTFAVRQPGPHRLTVRFSDGHTEHWDVEIESGQRAELRAERGTGEVLAPADSRPAEVMSLVPPQRWPFDQRPPEERPLRILLVRHAHYHGQHRPLEWRSDEEDHGGRLTDIGRRQSERLGHRLADIPIDHVYSTATPRTIETSRILREQLRHPHESTVVRGLAEVQGRHIRPDGDAEPEAIQEVADFARTLMEHGPGETILVVGHGTFNNLLVNLLANRDPKWSVPLGVDNTGVTILRIEPRNPESEHSPVRIELANCVRHLEE